VTVQGGQEPEYHVIADPEKLLRASVTITDLLNAVKATDVIDSPGLLERNHQLVLGLVSGQVHSAEELANVVVKLTNSGIPVRLGDVATVKQSVKPVYTIVRAEGKPAVLLNINRQPDSNTVAVADAVNKEVQTIQRSLPPGIQLRSFYDQSGIVRDSIAS